MEKLKSVLHMLEQVSDDRTVPRNIRGACDECIQILRDEKEEFSVKVNSCISILDEISNDPNIPIYTRTHIWNTVSMLEAVSLE